MFLMFAAEQQKDFSFLSSAGGKGIIHGMGYCGLSWYYKPDLSPEWQKISAPLPGKYFWLSVDLAEI